MSRVFRFSDHLSNTRNSEIIRKRYQQPVRRKETRVFARPPNIFLIHAVTESCMRVSSAAASKAEGEQKLTATLGSIWHKKTQTTGHPFEAGGKSGQIPNLQETKNELIILDCVWFSCGKSCNLSSNFRGNVSILLGVTLIRWTCQLILKHHKVSGFERHL